MIPAVPLKGFGSADCVQRDRHIRYIVYIVSQSADPNNFRGTGGKINLINNFAINIFLV